jgi:hypothetical protein
MPQEIKSGLTLTNFNNLITSMCQVAAVLMFLFFMAFNPFLLVCEYVYTKSNFRILCEMIRNLIYYVERDYAVNRQEKIPILGNIRNILQAYLSVCMFKGWAIKVALVPRPLMIHCASPLTAAMIITLAALRIVLAHGSKPT